jgi:hypothetical protein
MLCIYCLTQKHALRFSFMSVGSLIGLYIYRGADKSLARPISRCILFDGENISFDASLVVYINSTNIPPIIVINKTYETQNLCRCSLFPSCSG